MIWSTCLPELRVPAKSTADAPKWSVYPLIEIGLRKFRYRTPLWDLPSFPYCPDLGKIVCFRIIFLTAKPSGFRGFLALYFRPSPGQRVISRFGFALPSPGDQPAVSERFPLRDFPAVAISPDGTKIAYVGARGETTQLFLRAVDRLPPVQSITPPQSMTSSAQLPPRRKIGCKRYNLQH